MQYLALIRYTPRTTEFTLIRQEAICNLCSICLGVKYFMYFSVFGATENDGQLKSFLV
jgi:hypothetical protein